MEVSEADITCTHPGPARRRAGTKGILEDQEFPIVIGFNLSPLEGVDVVDVDIDLGAADGELFEGLQVEGLLLVVRGGHHASVVVHVDRHGDHAVRTPVVGVAVVLEVDVDVPGTLPLVADLLIVAGSADAAAAVVAAGHVGAVGDARIGNALVVDARAAGEAFPAGAATAVVAAVLVVTVRNTHVGDAGEALAVVARRAVATGTTTAVVAACLADAVRDADVRDA